MKKFLTILMVLITAMGLGFAEGGLTNPLTIVKPTPNPANATLSFTFRWSGQAADAKHYAGFYDSALVGVNSIDKLENLASKTSITTPVIIDQTTKTWSPNTEIYAAAGTNFIPAGGVGANITITFNPFKAAGKNDIGYTVDCTVISGGDVNSLKLDGEPSSAASWPGGEIKVENGSPAATPVNITATITATESGAASHSLTSGEQGYGIGPQYVEGTNGILELKFTNMKAIPGGGTGENPFAPTKGVDERLVTDYKATWVLQMTSN